MELLPDATSQCRRGVETYEVVGTGRREASLGLGVLLSSKVWATESLGFLFAPK